MTISTISEWKIDTSAGAPILMYKNCSVIESEQAEYVLSLIRNAEQPVLAVREAQSVPAPYNQVQRDMMKDIVVRKLDGNLLGETLDMDDIHAVTMELMSAGFRLHAAPPAVPNELPNHAGPREFGRPQAYIDGWNACRAAMLNHSGCSTEKVPDDTRRMDWLVAHHVEVRKPLLYGSEKFFTAQTLTDKEDDYHATSLREQIDAAMAAAPTPKK